MAEMQKNINHVDVEHQKKHDEVKDMLAEENKKIQNAVLDATKKIEEQRQKD